MYQISHSADADVQWKLGPIDHLFDSRRHRDLIPCLSTFCLLSGPARFRSVLFPARCDASIFFSLSPLSFSLSLVCVWVFCAVRDQLLSGTDMLALSYALVTWRRRRPPASPGVACGQGSAGRNGFLPAGRNGCPFLPA